jgi:hypothetical protein
MIGGCSEDLLSHLAEYLHQFSNTNNEFEHMIKEEYLAVIIRWIIETYNWNNSQEDLWIELYTYIFTFLHNHRFPQVQKAIFYALNSLWMDERHVLLREDIFINLKKVICSWTTYPEDVISICLLTFGSCLLTLKKLELNTPISNKLQSTLTILFQKSSSKVISIRAGFCLIFIQQLKITSGTILKWFSNKGDLISKERYNILLQQALYRKMDISYACTDAIVQYIHHDGLVDTFILDLYNYLCNKRRNNSNLFDFEPEYVFIAWQVINDNIDTFHRAVQTSSFGEQELKNELYFYFCYTNIGYDRIITIQIYASFGVLTIELVDMLKWTDDRFDVDDLWKYLKCIKQVYDRSAVEQLFEILDLMAYNTKFIRFSYILKLIIQLVEVHAISLLEVQQRVALVITKLSYENNWIEWQHEKHILDTLMNLTCIKSKLSSNTNTDFFTEDNIEKDFEGELQNFDKKSAMFLRRNYFLTIFSSLSNS